MQITMMVGFCKLWLTTLMLAGISPFPCSSFLPHPLIQRLTKRNLSNTAIFAKPHPEYRFDDDEESEANTSSDGGDYFSVTLPKEDPQADQTPSQRPEYGAFAQGTVVQVQVGDIKLARKAWKKRRRTGSPLLVPCSVLNVDRQSMVRWNLMFLLEKFGISQKDGIQISAEDLSNKYRTFLKSSLQKQANALSYESNHDMIKELFNKKIQESYGVRLIERDDELLLKAPISRQKAHKRTAKTPVLQFRLPRESDHGDADTLTHTGYLRSRKENSDDRSYHFLPLSAALRVTQKDDVDTGRVEEGSIHPAVVFDYDIMGDGGSPLLTLSLNPRGTRDTLKVKPDRRYMPIDQPRCTLDQLSAGEGPYRAKVVQFLPGRALVDMDVGRKVSSEGMVKVLGTLRFQDSVEFAPDPSIHDKAMVAYDSKDDYDESEAIIQASLDDLDNFDDDDEENDDEDDDEEDNDDVAEALLSLRANSSFEEGTFEEGEEEEDISDLFQVDSDGSLSYNDPDTGKTKILDAGDDEDEELEDVEPKSSKDFQKVSRAVPAKKRAAKVSHEDSSEKRLVSKRLRVGDYVNVYIRSVSKQSGQFAVTTNPLVQGRKAKDLKKESGTNKKLQNLKKSLGGSLNPIFELEGKECYGTVKATSKTGDWIYVQPELSGLPVGIATLSEEFGDVAAGDSVRVRIVGVDEERGQLALQVLDRHVS